MRSVPLFALILTWILCSPAARGDDADLAKRSLRILQDRCSRCHGQAAKQAGIDVLDRENLLQERGEIGSKFAFVVPGEVEKSQLLDAIKDGANSYMPQQGSPEAKAMTDEEKALLREWVEKGAPYPQREVRKFITEKQVLSAIWKHLLNSRADDRRDLRFYTFTHLQNNPAVSERDLRFYRAAFAKVVNSLSRDPEVYLPASLPETGESVFVINLRRLGWKDRNLWGEILKHYPYGLKYDFVKDEELQQLAKDVVQFSGSDLPYLRADWFIVTASQPPLYHTLLDIPKTLGELEHQLQLNIVDNINADRVQRSGYAKSGVSKQNRLLERHVSPATRYFWISYDFLPARARGDLTRFPLGPVYPGNPFRNQAFDHDGGEVIWSLPNGLQAYMLVKGTGERIDAGPVEVVFDRSAILGTPSIVNGISCMYCHREGMITEFRDEIRRADSVGGEAMQKVLRLYPEHEAMQRLTQQDQRIFVQSLESVVGPYLRVGDDAQTPINKFPEPVGKVAELYSRDLSAREVALELGIEKLETLQAKIEANRELLRYGLGALAQKPPATMKRDKWQTREGTSLMQDVSSELRMGIPYLP